MIIKAASLFARKKHQLQKKPTIKTFQNKPKQYDLHGYSKDDNFDLSQSIDNDLSRSLEYEGGGLLGGDNLKSLGTKQGTVYKVSDENEINVGSVFLRKSKDFKKMNELQKYKEIQRRTKLLYGVKDVRKMIGKTNETQQFYKKDICCNSDDENGGESESEKDKVQSKDKKVSLRDYLRPENFIISLESQWKTIFDTSILLVIGYSCFTTVLYISFEIQTGPFLTFIDHIVLACFALDFFFQFFQEYQDKETFAKVRSHKLLAIRYFKSGWMFLDFMATFPFDLFIDAGIYTRLIRLLRLTKLVKLLDIGRIKRLVKAYFDKSTRADRIQAQYMVMYSYKIFRLIIIVFMITYIIACFWWLLVRYVNTEEDIERGNTFIISNELDEVFVGDVPDKCYRKYCILPNDPCKDKAWQKSNCPQDILTQVIIVCYFALTTLSTVGYGDYYPISINEIIIGILYMLIGIVCFSQIMGSFIEIIQNYDQRMDDDNNGSDLNNWTLLLTRFASKPLSPILINQIDSHFSFFWAQNRLSSMEIDNEYLSQCPRQIKHHILLHYLFDDIIYRFRAFFIPRSQTDQIHDQNFLFEICFGLKPSKFSKSNEDRLILDEEDEVTDMYFLTEGKVGIGYYLMAQGLSNDESHYFGIKLEKHSFICDYYVCFNKKSEFIYMAIENISSYSLSKKFLNEEIFPKYPKIANKIKQGAELRYMKNIRRVLMDQRQQHIMEINKQSPYKSINITDKNSQNYEQGIQGKLKKGHEFKKRTNKHDHSSNQSQVTKGPNQTSLVVKSSSAGNDPGARNRLHQKQQQLSQQSGEQPKIQIDVPKHETDLSFILRKRLEGIQNEMVEFNGLIQDFAYAVDSEMQNFTVNMGRLQKNLNRVHLMKVNEDDGPLSQVKNKVPAVDQHKD